MGVKIPPLPDHTSEGEMLVVPEPGTDVAHLIYLLEYARRRGFRVGPAVQIGGLAIQVQDLRQVEDDPARSASDPGVWAVHGYSGDGAED